MVKLSHIPRGCRRHTPPGWSFQSTVGYIMSRGGARAAGRPETSPWSTRGDLWVKAAYRSGVRQPVRWTQPQLFFPRAQVVRGAGQSGCPSLVSISIFWGGIRANGVLKKRPIGGLARGFPYEHINLISPPYSVSEHTCIIRPTDAFALEIHVTEPAP